MRWTRVLRVVLGFLLAPIPVMLLFGMVAVAFLASFGRHEDPNKILLLVPAWAYSLTIGIGLPTHILLGRAGLRGMTHYLIAGVAISAMLACFEARWDYDLLSLFIDFFTDFIVNVHLVSITILLFWLIAVWQPRKTIGALRAAIQRRRPSHG